MDFCGRSLLVIYTCFTLSEQAYGYTNGIALPVKIKIYAGSSAGLQNSISSGIDCQNGGTKISSDTCLCPGGLSGKQCNHALFISFDTFENLMRLEGTELSNFNPQVTGRFNFGVATNKDRKQWFDLGFHPEVCLANKYGCGTSGGALSFYLRLRDCQENGGIITTRITNAFSGFHISCPSPGNLRYRIAFPTGVFRSDVIPVPVTVSFGYFHVLFNFIGPDSGQGFRVYHNGELVQNVTFKDVSLPFRSNDSNIVIGRSETFIGREAAFARFSSIDLDELMLFNHRLSDADITVLTSL